MWLMTADLTSYRYVHRLPLHARTYAFRHTAKTHTEVARLCILQNLFLFTPSHTPIINQSISIGTLHTSHISTPPNDLSTTGPRRPCPPPGPRPPAASARALAGARGSAPWRACWRGRASGRWPARCPSPAPRRACLVMVMVKKDAHVRNRVEQVSQSVSHTHTYIIHTQLF